MGIERAICIFVPTQECSSNCKNYEECLGVTQTICGPTYTVDEILKMNRQNDPTDNEIYTASMIQEEILNGDNLHLLCDNLKGRDVLQIAQG